MQCAVDVNFGQKGEQEDRRNTRLKGDPRKGLIIFFLWLKTLSRNREVVLREKCLYF